MSLRPANLTERYKDMGTCVRGTYEVPHGDVFSYDKFRFKSGSPVPYIEQAAPDSPHFFLRTKIL